MKYFFILKFFFIFLIIFPFDYPWTSSSAAACSASSATAAGCDGTEEAVATKGTSMQQQTISRRAGSGEQ
jgi:hypothetical protein